MGASGSPTDADLERHVEAELAAALERWPDVPTDRAALLCTVAALRTADEPAGAAIGWQLAELSLALACLAGHPAALLAFDRLLEEVAVPAVASRGLGRPEIDEVLQLVRVRLLVGGANGRPGLASYSGRGRLAGFLRSAAIRVALNLRRDERRRDGHAIDVLLADADQDPALRHMKASYLDGFRDALASAWDQLPAEEQLFLRHQLEDQLTIDDLAAAYAMHRSTAARRLTSARDRLATETRRALRQSLGLSEPELESVLRLIHSRLGDATGSLT